MRYFFLHFFLFIRKKTSNVQHVRSNFLGVSLSFQQKAEEEEGGHPSERIFVDGEDRPN